MVVVRADLFRCLVACVCAVCNKSQPPGAAGLSDSREAENSGLSLAYFHPVQSSRLGTAFSDSVRTAFGQMKIRRCASAPSRASSSGKSPPPLRLPYPSSISPSLSADVPHTHTHTSVALSNASLPQNKNDNKFPVEHNRRDDWGAEI